MGILIGCILVLALLWNDRRKFDDNPATFDYASWKAWERVKDQKFLHKRR